MKTLTKNFIIQNKLGLHARAAAQFVKVAGRFHANIDIKVKKQTVNGKSIMGILMLAAAQGTPLTLMAEGEDAAEAISALGELIENKFGEGA